MYVSGLICQIIIALRVSGTRRRLSCKVGLDPRVLDIQTAIIGISKMRGFVALTGSGLTGSTWLKCELVAESIILLFNVVMACRNHGCRYRVMNS